MKTLTKIIRGIAGGFIIAGGIAVGASVLANLKQDETIRPLTTYVSYVGMGVIAAGFTGLILTSKPEKNNYNSR